MNKLFAVIRSKLVRLLAKIAKANTNSKTSYYYLRFFSKKEGKIIERVAVGQPRPAKNGTMLYHDALKNGLRSFVPSNLCEQKLITEQAAKHYIQYL